MIISRLEITNYKQFAGEHVIDFPDSGAVAIIGHNGAGKTTLFEAVEWVLYGPKSIRNSDIRPRQGTGGAPLVRLTLQTKDGHFYQVERFFKGKSATAQANLYEVDADGEILSTIVSGPNDVSKWVAAKLVGLGNDAFVSTFFTRQKELNYFGSLGDTDRRRQVSRLLGQETIHDAQTLIADERRTVRSRATGLRTQYEHESSGRDFDAERAQFTEAASEAEGLLEEASQRVEARRTDLAGAREAEAYWRDLEKQRNVVDQERTAVTERVTAAQDRIASLDQQLARLDARETQLLTLRPIAARLDALRAEADRWQVEKTRADDLARLHRDRDAVERATTQRTARLREQVGTSVPVPGWAWRANDEGDPAAAADRLARLAAAIDADAARQYADGVRAASERDEQRAAAEEHVRKCETWLAKYHADLETALAGGDPETLARAADDERSQAAAERVAAETDARALMSDANKLRASVLQLEREGQGTCPTCGQAIDDVVLRTLRDGIRQRDVDAMAQRHSAAAASKWEAEAGQRRDGARGRAAAVAELRTRIETGDARTQEARETRDAAAAGAKAAFDAVGLVEVPSAETVTSARQRRAELESARNRAGTLAELAGQFRDDAERQRQTGDRIAALGEVGYDAQAHQDVTAAVERAQTARGQIDEITQEISQRADITSSRESAMALLSSLTARRQELERARDAVGFDVDSLASALAQAREADERHLAAINERNDRQTALRDARHHIETLDKDQQRLAGLAEQAGIADREADQLDRMYTGFDDFERWVAQQVNPILAERASGILSEVTGGQYDKVEFDENYALRIYDGDEAFPIARFSGGERDVASLAARLALSRVIGAQAHQPPAFVVLDEVFGSLDQERRVRLLSMLDALTNDDTDGFRQLFVISHVDDIRQSQAFDEVWRIKEDGQGVSQWENLQLTGGIEEL